MRIGNGYDVHRLVEGRKLMWGGVHIPFEKGLFGHSDADVLTHAIMDALLGAAGEGDIGRHFPDTDEKYKDADSVKLLEKVGEILQDKLYVIENIDAVLMAERPKIAPYIPEMRKKLSAALGIEEDRINIKATTEEGLGFVGLGEGMKAQAAALLNEVINEDTFMTGGGCGGCDCPMKGN